MDNGTGHTSRLPHAAALEAFFAQARELDETSAAAARAAWDARDWAGAERDAAWGDAVFAARRVSNSAEGDPAWDALWVSLGRPGWEAALALAVRDQLTDEQFEWLAAPVRAAGVTFEAAA